MPQCSTWQRATTKSDWNKRSQAVQLKSGATRKGSSNAWRQEKKEKYLLFTRLLSLPLDICASVVIRQQILRDRAWQAHQQRATAGMLSLTPLQSPLAFPPARPQLNRRRVSAGHEPDRHPVGAGHRPGRQARGLRLQPPSEGARAPAAAGAAGAEAAASAAGEGEGAAGAAAAGRGDGRVHPPPATQWAPPAARRAPSSHTGTIRGACGRC